MDTYDNKKIKNHPKTNNKLASAFLVSVYHADNHSLQGVIHWLDSDKKLSFRSDFELLMLLYEAIKLSGATGESLNSFRQWNDVVKTDVM